MRVGDYCKRHVVTAETSDDILQVAATMRDGHVGFLVIAEPGDPARKPVGVITDRDIVLQVCAKAVDARSVTAADVMSRDPLVACDDDDLSEALQAMRISGFRRVPVVTAAGQLTGVLAIDDAIDIVAGLICDISGSIRNEQRQERRRLSR